MKIDIRSLKEGIPKELEEVYDPKTLDLELVDLKFLTSLTAKGVAVKEYGSLNFKGELTTRVKRICGRTLKEVEEDVCIPFQLYYPIEGREEIDVLDDLRETFFEEQPMVYYAPGTESGAETITHDPDIKSDSDEKKENPFEGLKKIRDRLKEE